MLTMPVNSESWMEQGFLRTWSSLLNYLLLMDSCGCSLPWEMVYCYQFCTQWWAHHAQKHCLFLDPWLKISMSQYHTKIINLAKGLGGRARRDERSWNVRVIRMHHTSDWNCQRINLITIIAILKCKKILF